MFTSPFEKDIGFCFLDSGVCRAPKKHAAEQALLSARSVPLARLSFTLGRAAAHQALEQIGLAADSSILRNSDGSPQWPRGVVGSISHSRREDLVLAVAAVGDGDAIESIGLDVERLERPISDAFIKRVCTTHEIEWLLTKPDLRKQRAQQIFSAKETLFKLFAPIFSGPKTFHGAELKFDPVNGAFEATWIAEMSKKYPAGSRHWVAMQMRDGFVFTAAALLNSSRWCPSTKCLS